ncbi:MAG: hypothetical protein HYX53_09470 [Chloroflexi bacterium]|nr:hypothetical protein [Chloroflexota bacterium]
MNLTDLDMAPDVRRFWWLLPPACLALVIFTATQFAAFFEGDGPVVLTDPVNQQYQTGPAPTVTIDNWAGDVRVAGARDNLVLITAVRRGTGRNEPLAFEDLSRIQLQMQQEGDHVLVQTWREVGGGNSESAPATIDVTVPAGARIEIRTNYGKVLVTGVIGGVTVLVPNGDITVQWPRDVPFRLDGTGDLNSEFKLSPLGKDSALPAYSAGATPAAALLDLRAARGKINLLRR